MLARLRAIFGGAPEEANEQGWPRPSPAANGDAQCSKKPTWFSKEREREEE